MIEGIGIAALLSGAIGKITLGFKTCGAGWSIACDFEGAPYSVGLKKAYFVERTPTEGEPTASGRMIMGLAFIERLSGALGYTLKFDMGASGRQRVQLKSGP